MNSFQPLHLGKTTLTDEYFDLNNLPVYKNYTYNRSDSGKLVAITDIHAITDPMQQSINLINLSLGSEANGLQAQINEIVEDLNKTNVIDLRIDIEKSHVDIEKLTSQLTNATNLIELLNQNLQALYNNFGYGAFKTPNGKNPYIMPFPPPSNI
jgi:hypothetical protein